MKNDKDLSVRDYSKVDRYIEMLHRYGEVDYRFNGTYIKIRENDACDGYKFNLYEETEEGNYYLFHAGNLKSTPFHVIDYIFGIITGSKEPVTEDDDDEIEQTNARETLTELIDKQNSETLS